ncbi:MAG: YwiC-like family protein, partial [Candidatus Marinimicrobia bacterium]|nr:YwiC-like family protein [Candidatus Neomarinimicrobiota bacterium]
MNAAPSPWRRWLRPPLSAEHGATITLLVSFFTGAWLAGRWSNSTTLALLAAMAAFQTQAPLARMLRRRSLDGPNAVWLALYSGISAGAALHL